ncbi:hypothetical protein [Paenibacillus qinlingensis]|uniref:Chromosome segregation ATPase n=1 Tax=Paenibacillus qinlingensis TaxID=1837343 RepID=A0ABU1P6R7_9BACL|nr:hypothetical protein [Paenibacillus qinlingensis]MDR6555455.1 chromosome segregation ATPase [Paenibacillus qinlingensis]
MSLTSEQQQDLKQELDFTRERMSTLEVDSEAYNVLAQRADEIIYSLQSGDFEERIKKQEETVQAIKLPHDFSELFDDHRANDIIIELIKQFQRQAYADHNEEIVNIISAHKQDQEATKQQITELQDKIAVDAQDLYNCHQTIFQLNFELEDVKTKRDAAVEAKEEAEQLLHEKQLHLDKLQNEIANGAKEAAKPVEITLTDRLSELVEQSKSAKIKSSLELALERTAPVRGTVEITKPVGSQFRPETSLDGVVEVPDLGLQFPVIPKAEVPTVSVPGDIGQPEIEEDSRVTKEYLEARLAQFAQENGLVVKIAS